MKAKIIGIVACVIVVSLCTLITSKSADAGCNRVAVNAVNYTPVVNTEFVPIAYPVIVPAFQFQYQPPVCVQAAAVLPAVPGYSPGYAPGYAPPGLGNPPIANGASAASQNDRIRELAKALLEEMNHQAGGDGQESAADDGPPVASGPLSAAPTRRQQYAAAPARNINPQAIAQQAVSILSRSCAACHTGAGAKDGVAIFSQPGVINPNAPWAAIEEAIERGRMPPKLTQYHLTGSDAFTVRTWLGG